MSDVRAVAPAPSGVGYRAYSTWRGPPANRNAIVGELADARSLRLHFDLTAPATASITVDGRSSSLAGLQELSQDLVIFRWNPYTASYRVLFRGVIGHTQDELSETTHSVNVQAADYRAVLGRAVLGGPFVFTNEDQAHIANYLVLRHPPYDGSTPPYDLGVSSVQLSQPDGTPIAVTGVTRDRSYTGAEKSADMLNNLAAVIDGFDWGMEPVDPFGSTLLDVSALTRLWYPQRGVAKPFVAEYGSTVSRLSRTVDSTGFANWVRNDGTNDDAGNPQFAVAMGDVVTNPQLHAEGLWERGISHASTAELSALEEQAEGELASASVLIPSYSLTLIPGAWRWRDDCWLGDTIAIRVRSGRLDVDTSARIVQIDIAVNDNGTETVTLTVARTVQTLAGLLIAQRSELDALSRR